MRTINTYKLNSSRYTEKSDALKAAETLLSEGQNVKIEIKNTIIYDPHDIVSYKTNTGALIYAEVVKKCGLCNYFLADGTIHDFIELTYID